MPECPNCGRWVEPDPETGYDVDELCPACKEDEYWEQDEWDDDWDDYDWFD